MGANEQPVVLQRHRVTVGEYYRMAEAGILAPDARVELVEGEVIDMAPMKSAHAWALNQLAAKLHEAARGRAVVTCQTPLTLGTHSEPEPDLMLVRNRPEGYATQHPGPADVLLLIEVADSSLEYDRQVKMPLYARHGIAEAWIVDLANRQVRFFRRPAGEAYADITATETPGSTAVGALPGLTVDLSGLFG
ncbi:MAG: Uma2 family endonuclease [Burkholderiales bacterium]|nr:Uma2 family endonuclease [Burkholderiales bacterium]